MKVLVLGGTGTVGSQVARELHARGQEVYVLTRDAAKAKTLPKGMRPVVGNLLDPATIRNAFRGMDGLFLLNGNVNTETTEGILAADGAVMGGVKYIVYLSVHHADRAPHLPHFGGKLPIELVVQRSGIPYTILRPNNFYQNDNWFKAAILEHGVYPQPIGAKGISRVDVRDIAELAALVLTTPGHAGKTYDVVGPHVLTGAQTAEIWSGALGRKITYAGDDLDVWEQQQLQYGMPPWLVMDFRLMYEYFQKGGWVGTDQDVKTLSSALGHAPRDFESFAKEMAKQWTSS